MSLQIKLKNSVVQDSTPSASDLPEVGELAVNGNINSIGGFMRASDNTIVKIFGPGSVTTPTATTTVSGISELATNSETTTGTATNRVVTPAGLNAVTVAERTTSNTNYVAKAGSTMTGVLTATAGSNSAPAINFGDSDSGIFGGTNTVSLAAGGTTRLTADTGVTITGALSVSNNISTSAGQITCGVHGTSGIQMINDGTFGTINSADLKLRTGATERARIDTSGRLLVGTSSSRTVGGNTHKIFQIEGTDAQSGIAITRNSATNTASMLSFGKSRGTSNGTSTIVQDDDQLGRINFAGADGTDTVTEAAKIEAFVDGTPGSNDMPGRLVFSTTADGAAASTTRLTIDSAGLVKLPDNGKFVAGDSSDLQIYHDGTNSNIKNNTNQLNLLGNDIRLLNNGASKALIKAFDSGAAELYYDGSKKLNTTATGATITGTCNMTSLNCTSSGSTGANFTVGGDLNVTGNIDVADNVKIKLGTGDDLQIFHDGSNSFIKNTTLNSLYINSASHIYLANADNSEFRAKFHNNSSVELYFDSSKKFQTTASGVSISGDVSIGNDTGKFLSGAGNDLQLYHDGGNSVIDNLTGGLFIKGTGSTAGIQLQNRNGNESMAKFFPDGAVELYHNNSKKFETESGGAKVSGLLTVDGNIISYSASNNSLGLAGHRWNDLFIANDIDILDDGKLLIGTGDDLQIFHNGTNSLINNTLTTGSFFIKGNSLQITSFTNTEKYITAVKDGAVELYYDNSKKFETTSTGVKLGGDLDVNNSNIKNGTAILDITTNQRFEFGVAGTTVVDINGNGVDFKAGDNTHADNVKSQFGASNDLQIYHDGSNSLIADEGTGALVLKSNQIDFIDSTSTEFLARFFQNSAVEFYFDGGKKFETTSTGVSFANGADATTSKLILALGNASTKEATIQGTSTSTNEKGIHFKTYHFASVDALTITPAGLVGIGTISPTSALEVRAPSATHQLVSINREDSDTGALFLGCNSSNNGIIAANNTDILFGRDLSNSFTERMRLRNDGKLLINRTGTDGSGMLQVAVSGVGITTATGSQGSTTHLEFRNQSGTVGTIKTSGNNSSFNTSSDYRLKENVVAIADGIRRLKQLKPKKFNWISDETDTLLDGFLAHEVADIIPEAVTGEKDAVDTDGKPEWQQIDHSKLVPLLVAAVQELIGRVETLETA